MLFYLHITPRLRICSTNKFDNNEGKMMIVRNTDQFIVDQRNRHEDLHMIGTEKSCHVRQGSAQRPCLASIHTYSDFNLRDVTNHNVSFVHVLIPGHRHKR